MLPRSTALTIDAPPERLWSILTDTLLWPRWGTSIEKVRCPDRFIGKGSKGTVKIAHLPLHLPFEVTAFDAQRMFWSWEVSGFEATSHQIKRTPGARPCVVIGVPGALQAPYLAICKIALRNIARMVREDVTDPAITSPP